ARDRADRARAAVAVDRVAGDAAVAGDRQGCIRRRPAARPRLEAAVREQIARIGPRLGREREQEQDKQRGGPRWSPDQPGAHELRPLLHRLLPRSHATFDDVANSGEYHARLASDNRLRFPSRRTFSPRSPVARTEEAVARDPGASLKPERDPQGRGAMQAAGSSKTVVIRGRVVKPDPAEELGRGGLSAAIRTLRQALAIDAALRPPSVGALAAELQDRGLATPTRAAIHTPVSD